KKDTVVTVGTSKTLCDALPGGPCTVGGFTGPKIILQPDCTSHPIVWESCSGQYCNGWRGPHASLAKNIGDYVLTGMIYASPGQDRGCFTASGVDGWNDHCDTPV